MFPFLPRCDLDDDAIAALADHMKGNSTPNFRIAAGYTYLGQFIDHDITFDPLSKLDRANDPHTLVNFRTPRFDLDSLYGSGPADQPFLYDWDRSSQPGVKLLVGHNPCGLDLAHVDLPRNDCGRALIGDARNDENLVVAQLHLLFIRFHNNVVEYLCDEHRELTGGDLFAEAQHIVRWHYQWIITHDYLPKIVGEPLASDVLKRAGFSGWHYAPVIPVEFSGAAFRFGHSMVRIDYRTKKGGGVFPIFRRPGEPGDHLGGFRRLPAKLEIEWDLYFFQPPPPHPPPDVNPSMRLDAKLESPLFSLPPDGESLAALNLKRAAALGLPSGRDVAKAISAKPLTDDELLAPGELPDFRAAVLASPPLWYYILREAKVRGQDGCNLGPVGGQIVAEVLVGLLAGDPHSYLHHWPAWSPFLGPVQGSFTMLDLVRFATDDR